MHSTPAGEKEPGKGKIIFLIRLDIFTAKPH
jgi:hypothetical protein